MQIQGLDRSKLALERVDLEQLKSRMSSGNAVLITGAGFSQECENIVGENPPLAKALSHKLCESFGIDISDNLKYVSDVCSRAGNKEQLLNLLKDCFTLVSPAAYNVEICSIPWRRIYTTNYDNSIELSYLMNKKSLESVSLIDNTKEFVKLGKEICVHLNGAVSGAVTDDLDSQIRLSDASYLSADFFLKSRWRSVFNKDLEHCSAIVFVGYSLYDFDIEKVLHDRPHLADKTYFVTHKGASHESTYKLSNYGHVTDIGAEGFGKLVSEVILDNDDCLALEALSRKVVTEEVSTLNDHATHNMLLYGNYEESDVVNAIRSGFGVPYMFKINIMETVCSSLVKSKNVLIQSDLGNGKSVFLDHVSTQLALDGYNVWVVSDFEGRICKDLDVLSSCGEHIIVLDEVSDQSDFIEYYLALQPANITLLLADRSVNSFPSVDQLNENGYTVLEYSLNGLVDSEIEDLIIILDDQNLWGHYTALSFERKVKLIGDKYSSQLSNLLLGLLKSPDIKARVTNLISEILEEEDYKKTIFSIALCDIFNIRKELNIIADIAGNEEIYTSRLRGKKAFKSLFSIGEGRTIVTKSSVFSLFLINDVLSDVYVVESCLEIMRRIDNRDESHYVTLQSKLRTFHNMEKLLPQKQSPLNNYFVELKRTCTWLRYHPHFWVQYAMCRLSFEDLVNAQQHLNTAYEFASKKKKAYHTENIDTQQARLYLKLACKTGSELVDIISYFEKAHKLLSGIKNDNHKFRQVLSYEEFYKINYEKLSKGKRVVFEMACKNMLSDAENARHIATAAERTNFIEKSISTLSEIITDIESNRSQ